MEILTKALSSLGTVVVIGLLLGAGLPAVFAAGLRALSMGQTVSADGQDAAGQTSPAGRALAFLCFAVVVAAALFGIVVIVFGGKIFGGH